MSRLFDLLPALYRIRDAGIAQSQQLLTLAEQSQLAALQSMDGGLSADEQAQLTLLTAKVSRGPLESLLMLVEEQLAVVAGDLDQLYDDQFIETCANWVIPYIGDLIGYQAVNGIAPAVASPRAEVANTISFRRRKGTALVMEQLARDVTGWGAHAVEMFEVLSDTQYMHHLRLFSHYSPDLRRWKPGLYIESGFDRTTHKVDVRRIASGRGRYNIQNIGIFLWSLTSYSVTNCPATPVKGTTQCFRFSSLGRDIALFNNPVSQGVEITSKATPVNVPARLRRRVLCDDLQNGAGAAYYGEGNSLAIYVGGQLLNAYQIRVCNLSGDDGSWMNVPAAGSVFAAAVDPELGRISLAPPPAGKKADVRVSFHYGFNANVGGGEYERSATFAVRNEAQVLPFPDTASPARYTTLKQAFAYAAQQLQQQGQIALEIGDSGIYTTPAISIDLPAGTTFEVRAADEWRPTLIANGEIAVTGGASSSFVLNGIVLASSAKPSASIAAQLHAPAARPDGSPSLLQHLQLTHCTLAPGWLPGPQGDPTWGSAPSLIVEPSGVEVIAANSILGAMRVAGLATASLTNSIVDATSRTNAAYAGIDGVAAGGALTLDGCTVIGKVHAALFTLISNSIIRASVLTGDGFAAALWSDRKQTGCVRFKLSARGVAITPRQYECVVAGPQMPEPIFFSLLYGDSGYAKLLSATNDAIRRGADDGGEMGAFHFVLAPQRETDLKVRMQEYLPVGLEFGIIYQN